MEQLRDRAAVGFGYLGVQRIAQHQLNSGLVAGQAQHFRLLRRNQQVYHRHGDGLSFGIFLEVLAGGEHLHVLQQGLGDGAQRGRPGRIAGYQYIHPHAGHGKAGHSYNFIHPYGHRAHAFGDQGRQAGAPTLEGQAGFHYGFAAKDGRNHAAPDDILLLPEDAFGYGSGPISLAKIRVPDKGAGLQVPRSQNEFARPGRRLRRHAAG